MGTTVKARARRALRRTLPPPLFDAVAERRRSRGDLTTAEFEDYRLLIRDDLLVVEPRDVTRPPSGVYLYGGCDLPSLFAMGPVLGPTSKRTVVVHQPGFRMAMARPDILLQTLRRVPRQLALEVTERMQLTDAYFRPEVFRPTFDTHVKGIGRVEKSAIVFSGGGSIIRPAYRHKEGGFLVDPGARWLRRSDDRISREDREWFANTFESVGRLSMEQFAVDFRVLVAELRQRTNAEIVVLDVLTVEPGVQEHNYQLRRSPEAVRRLEFHLVLEELAEDLGIHVVDVDDALKRAGVREQVDFAHFPVAAYEAVAGHAARVLAEIGVV
jgi:hypothetical protein